MEVAKTKSAAAESLWGMDQSLPVYRLVVDELKKIPGFCQYLHEMPSTFFSIRVYKSIGRQTCQHSRSRDMAGNVTKVSPFKVAPA